jgi:hypothetical protein
VILLAIIDVSTDVIKEVSNSIVYPPDDGGISRRFVHSVLHKYLNQRDWYRYKISLGSEDSVEEIFLGMFGLFSALQTNYSTVVRDYVLYVADSDVNTFADSCRKYVEEYLPEDSSPTWCIFNFPINTYEELVMYYNMVSNLYGKLKLFYDYTLLKEIKESREQYEIRVNILNNFGCSVLDIKEACEYVKYRASVKKDLVDGTIFDDVKSYLDNIEVDSEKKSVIMLSDSPSPSAEEWIIAPYLLKTKGVLAYTDKYMEQYVLYVRDYFVPYQFMTAYDFVMFFRNLPDITFKYQKVSPGFALVLRNEAKLDLDILCMPIGGDSLSKVIVNVDDIDLVDVDDLFVEEEEVCDVFSKFEMLNGNKTFCHLGNTLFFRRNDDVLCVGLILKRDFMIPVRLLQKLTDIPSSRNELDLDCFQLLCTVKSDMEYERYLGAIEHRISSFAKMNKKLNLDFYDVTDNGSAVLYYNLSTLYKRNLLFYNSINISKLKRDMFNPVAVASRSEGGLVDKYIARIGLQNLRRAGASEGLALGPCGLSRPFYLDDKTLKGVM